MTTFKIVCKLKLQINKKQIRILYLSMKNVVYKCTFLYLVFGQVQSPRNVVCIEFTV